MPPQETLLPQMVPPAKRIDQYYRQSPFLPGKSQSKTGSALFRRKVSQNRKFFRAFQQAKGSTNNLVLEHGIVRFAQGIAKRKRDNEASRGPHFHSDHLQQRKPDRRDSRLLNNAPDQSHGLVAHGSGRDQECRVHSILLKDLCNLWRRIRDQPTGCGNRAHETKMPVIQPSDFSPLHKIPQAVKRKHQVRVLCGSRLVKIRTPLGDLQTAHVNLVRQFPKGKITATESQGERRLPRKVYPSRRNED
jgi:hypothetical protein